MSRQRPTPEQRRVVRIRARGACEYCQSQEDFATESFSIDHIIPVVDDGETAADNLALACQGCNSYKYTKTSAQDPTGGKITQLFHPRQQRWDEHFRWNADFTEIIGVTPTGRATVSALKLNRRGLINLRRALYALGEHPPK